MATIFELVDLLGPDVVRVVVAPLGLDVRLDEVVLYDAADPPVLGEGSLLLGIGLSPVSTASVVTMRPAPAAVVLKHEGPLDDGLLAEAVAAGVTLLAVPRQVSWSTLVELAQALTSDATSMDRAGTPTSARLVEDLFAVANAVAARVEAPITIEDTQSRLLAYSAQHEGVDAARAATILGHRVPAAYRAEIRRLGVAKRLLTETAPIFVPTSIPGISPRVVIALRARGTMLGSMWAIADEPFDAERDATFAAAARSASLRLWQHQVAADLQREQRARMLAMVLAGGPAALEVGHRLRLEAGGYRLLAATLRPGPAERRGQLESVVDVLRQQIGATQPATLAAEIAGTACAVLPCSSSPSQSAQEARDAAARLRAAVGSLASDLVVARSGHCSSLAEMAQSWDEAQGVLRVLLADTSGRCDADIEEVGPQVVLQRFVELQRGRPLLHNPVVDAIAAHDEQHQTSYLQTLEAHLWSFGDAAAAAARLNVHTNTFRYRLRRLSEMFPLDLDDADARFALMLQFRLLSSP